MFVAVQILTHPNFPPNLSKKNNNNNNLSAVEDRCLTDAPLLDSARDHNQIEP